MDNAKEVKVIESEASPEALKNLLSGFTSKPQYGCRDLQVMRQIERGEFDGNHEQAQVSSETNGAANELDAILTQAKELGRTVKIKGSFEISVQ